MKKIFVCLCTLVFFGCSNTDEVPIDVSYEGETFSFMLEELEIGMINVSGGAFGDGFVQALGGLDAVFTEIFKGYQIKMDPKWEGRTFKLSINYSEDREEYYFFEDLIEQIQSKAQITISSKAGMLEAKCLNVVGKENLQRNIYQIDQGILESSNLFGKKLKVAGKTLGGLVDELNKVGHLKRILFKGQNKDVYQFELDVTNEASLNNSLLLYGLSLSDCEVETRILNIR